MSTSYFTIQARQDSAAAWASTDPIPALGEPCFETDTGLLKIGDGVSHYSTLNYFPFVLKSGTTYTLHVGGVATPALIFGASDPSTAGVTAPIGSVYCYTVNGSLYSKIGAGDTAWMPHVIYGTADPTAGAGVAAPIGALYSNTSSGALYSKTGAGDTAWTSR